MVSVETSINTIMNMWELRDAAEALPKHLRPHHDVTHWPPQVIHGLASLARQVLGEEGQVDVHAAAERAVGERTGGEGEGGENDHFGIEDLEIVMQEVVGDGEEGEKEVEGEIDTEGPVQTTSGKRCLWYIEGNDGITGTGSQVQVGAGDAVTNELAQLDAANDLRELPRTRSGQTPASQSEQSRRSSQALLSSSLPVPPSYEPDDINDLDKHELSRRASLNWAEQPLSNVFPKKMCPANLPSVWRIGILKELHKLSCKSKGMQNFRMVVKVMEEVYKSKTVGSKATTGDIQDATKIYEKMRREWAHGERGRAVSAAVVQSEPQQTSAKRSSKRKRGRVEDTGGLDGTQEEDAEEAIPASPPKRARNTKTRQVAVTEAGPTTVQRKVGTRTAQTQRRSSRPQSTTATAGGAATSQIRQTRRATAPRSQSTHQQSSTRQPPTPHTPMTPASWDLRGSLIALRLAEFELEIARSERDMAAIALLGASLEEEKLKVIKADKAVTEAYKVVQEMGRKVQNARKESKDDDDDGSGGDNAEEVGAEEDGDAVNED
jgi:hypothetical protein